MKIHWVCWSALTLLFSLAMVAFELSNTSGDTCRSRNGREKTLLVDSLRRFNKDAPRTVVLALLLILPTYAFQVYALIRMAIVSFAELTLTPAQVKGAVLFGALWAAALALGLFVIVAIVRRKKFARVFVLTAFALWTLTSLTFEARHKAPLLSWLYVAFGAGSALLFVASSSAWFNLIDVRSSAPSD
ncbi:hypothetical protein AB4Y45_04400 [Paraburkholderia sp. EG287A]|uniref:hypothetical protein n=1 Tax=unclassified Paraburkholderia TaxID=2615204 RepID=UPI0034D37823